MTPTNDPDQLEQLIARICEGDANAAATVFVQFRPRLRKMVELRMDRRLRGRVDPSDILQEAYIDYSKRVQEYANRDDMPFFLWIRMLTGQKLQEIHQRHFGAQLRDVRREAQMPGVNSFSLADFLLGSFTTPSGAIERSERKQQLEQTLDKINEQDREVLALRHFEDLSNGEVATLLGISKAAASNRYVRALQRLSEALSAIPGFFDES